MRSVRKLLPDDHPGCLLYGNRNETSSAAVAFLITFTAICSVTRSTAFAQPIPQQFIGLFDCDCGESRSVICNSHSGTNSA